MKANTPDKIWIGKYTQNLMLSDPNSNTYVEYIRIDNFIEKACDAYCRLCDTKECGDTGECDWVGKFRKRLMR